MAEVDQVKIAAAGYGQGYSADVDMIRQQEYPSLNGEPLF